MSTDAEMATLTGAYAMDALTGPEKQAFEQHMAGCPDCASEVAEFRETGARLGTATTMPPPEGLKERVLWEVRGTRQDPPHTQDDGHDARLAEPIPLRSRRRLWATRLTAAAAVVGIAAAAAFGAMALQMRQELNQADGTVAVSELFQAGDTRILNTSEGGMRATVVMSQQLDRAMFISGGIEQVPAGKTYQVWFIGESGAISAGLIKQDEAGNTKPIMAPIPEGTETVGVTLEPAGGSPKPTSNPVLTLPMPA